MNINKINGYEKVLNFDKNSTKIVESNDKNKVVEAYREIMRIQI